MKIDEAMKKNINEYPTWTAVYDVDEYHRCCSFIGGLVEVTKALETRKQSKTELEAGIKALSKEIADNKKENPENESKALVAEREKLQLLLGSAPQ